MGKRRGSRRVDFNIQIRFDEEGRIFDPVTFLKEFLEAVKKRAQEKEKKGGSSTPELPWWNREPDERGRRL